MKKIWARIKNIFRKNKFEDVPREKNWTIVKVPQPDTRSNQEIMEEFMNPDGKNRKFNDGIFR